MQDDIVIQMFGDFDNGSTAISVRVAQLHANLIAGSAEPICTGRSRDA